MTLSEQSSTTEQTAVRPDAEPLSFDETVKRALAFCDTLPDDFTHCRTVLGELQTRLSKGRLHFAVLGQFNRGKSTFINALLRIKTLPTSVLPLTSVPTVIEYGAELNCKIRFLDDREAITVTESEDEMVTALRKYVAEENNPKNQFNVKDATVACPSELLANGTVLIDTPGFGSTHLHNTKTTLDLLIECDAALFLLSADPPMTQTEMEFLRMVKERVPKLYFVLNKVDLLTDAELEEVHKFIMNIITDELDFPKDTPLYHTCAVKGGRAKNADPKDPDWVESGLEAIKKEILDFMVREKYFTLSEALSDKYKEVMSETKAQLEKKLSDITDPLKTAKDEIAAITNAIRTINLELKSQTEKIAAERSALDVGINMRTANDTKAYKQSMQKALDILLGDKYFPTEAASIASTLLPKHSNDLGAKQLAAIIEFANKSIRALVMNHTIAFDDLRKRYAEYLNVDTDGKTPDELIRELEIILSDSNKMFYLAEFPMPQPQLFDIFRKKSVRFQAIREFYEPLCDDSIMTNIKSATERGKSMVSEAWGKMQATVRGAYQEMIDEMETLRKEKQTELDNRKFEVIDDIEFLRGRIDVISSYGF